MSSRSDSARRIARCIAYRTFRGHWDLKALLDDAESVAWQLETTAPPHVAATSIGAMAVKRIHIGRQFRQSIRSITTKQYDKRCKRPSFTQVQIHLDDLTTRRENPADLTAFWMDFKAWLERWDSRKRAIAEGLAVGGRTGEIADEFDLSAGRIAQLRREFEHDWQKYQHVS